MTLMANNRAVYADARRILRLAAVGVAAAFSAFCWSTLAAEWDGRTLLKQVIESRRGIKRGHLILESIMEQVGGAANHAQPLRSERRWEIWFVGSKLRGDLQRNGITEVNCSGGYLETAHVFYTDAQPSSPNLKMALVITEVNETNRALYYVPEPRWFGCIPADHMNAIHFHPISFYTPPDSATVEVARDLIAGEHCLKVTYKANPGPVVSELRNTVWVSSQNPNSVRQVEQQQVGPGIAIVDVVTSTCERVKHTAIWFPASWHHERRENGKVTQTEDARVRIITLNEPVDPAVFTPKGIAILPKGTPVEWQLPHDRPHPDANLVWNGSSIVPHTLSATDGRQGPLRSMLLIANVAVLLAVVAALLYRQLARRHRAT